MINDDDDTNRSRLNVEINFNLIDESSFHNEHLLLLIINLRDCRLLTEHYLYKGVIKCLVALLASSVDELMM